MNVEQQIHGLSAETLAVQTVLSQTLYRLSLINPEISRAIQAGSDDAANVTERLAIHFGKAASPEHTRQSFAHRRRNADRGFWRSGQA